MLALLLRVTLDPAVAGHVVAAVLGDPEVGARLESICERESGCRVVGVHRCDAHRSTAAWVDAAIRMRTLEPGRCSHHRLDAAVWSTSGPWGMMRAYSLHRLGGCWPAWVLDVPIVGAAAAVLRMRDPLCARVHGCARWSGLGRRV